MRKKKTMFVSLILLCFVICCIPLTASAATEYVEGYLRYAVEDGSITITGYNGQESEVTVPASIAGTPVNTIASGAFSNAATVTKINLPDTIMKMEEGAFSIGQAVIYNYNTDTPIETKPEQPGNQDQPSNQNQSDESDQSVVQDQPAVNETPNDQDMDIGGDVGVNEVTQSPVVSVEEVDIDFEDHGESSEGEAENIEIAPSNDSSSVVVTEITVPKPESEQKRHSYYWIVLVGIIAIVGGATGIIVYRKKK